MKLLRFADLKERGIVASRMTLWRYIRNQGFPQPIKLSQTCNAWPESEVNAWLAARPGGRPITSNTEAAA